MASSSQVAPPVAARASTQGGLSLTVATFNIGANSHEMFQGKKGQEFKDKLINDVGLLKKVMAF